MPETSHLLSLAFLLTISTGAVSQELVDEFKYYSEYVAAAYCSPQQKGQGQKINCAGYGTCPQLEKVQTRVYSTWYQYVNTHIAKICHPF